jgi:single-strand DNA-binding protein
MAQNNQVILIGNLGQDPRRIEKETKSFVALSLCTQDSYKDKDDDEWKQRKEVWHDVLVFGPQAQGHARYFRKGQRVRIEGFLSYRDIKGEDGHTHQEATIIATKIEAAPLPQKAR